MKPFLQTLFLYFFGIAFAFAQTNNASPNFEDFAEYNNYIVAENNKISVLMLKYSSEAVHNPDETEVLKLRIDIIKHIAQTYNQVSRMPSYENDPQLRDEAVKILEEYLNTYKVDYDVVSKLKVESLTSYEALKAFYDAEDKADLKIKAAMKRFREAQGKFAKKYGGQMEKETPVKDKLAEISETARKVGLYQKDLTLVYFRVSSELDNFVKALNEKQTPEKLDVFRQKIITYSDLSLQKLAQIKAYENETVFRKSIADNILSMKNLAKEDLNVIVETKRKQAKNAMKNEDVDQYNAAVEKFNKENERYSNTYNTISDQFLKKYFPKF